MAAGTALGIGVAGTTRGITVGTVHGTARGIGAVGMILGIGARLGASAGAGAASTQATGAVSMQAIGMAAIGGIIIIMHLRAITMHRVCGLRVPADGARPIVLPVRAVRLPIMVCAQQAEVAVHAHRHLRCVHLPEQVCVTDGLPLPIGAV